MLRDKIIKLLEMFTVMITDSHIIELICSFSVLNIFKTKTSFLVLKHIIAFFISNVIKLLPIFSLFLTPAPLDSHPTPKCAFKFRYNE